MRRPFSAGGGNARKLFITYALADATIWRARSLNEVYRCRCVAGIAGAREGCRRYAAEPALAQGAIIEALRAAVAFAGVAPTGADAVPR